MRWAIVIAIAVAAAPARADDTNAGADARAKVLFDEGKTLFAEGKYGAACDKLDASFKLSRLSSTRGLLAACFEKIGKLASAWVAYRDSAAIADKQGNAERAQAARDKAAELEPKLAWLKIDIAAVRQVKGLEVTIDGAAQPTGALDQSLPIDAGPHVIAADAAGWKKWTATIDIADGEKQSATVAALVADPAELEAKSGGKKLTRRKLVGLGFGAAGVGSIGVAIAFGVVAKLEWSDAGCTSAGVCPSLDAKSKADSAARSANIATGLGAVGLVLAGTGAVIYLTGPKHTELRPLVKGDAAGVTLAGRW